MEAISNQKSIQQNLEARVDDIAEKWFQGIFRTSYSPFEESQIRGKFREMTLAVISLLPSNQFDPQKANLIGISLAKLHLIQPEVLGRSQSLLSEQLLDGLSADDLRFLQPRLVMLLSELATGFINQARQIVLNEQEQIRSALVSEIQAADQALREINDELERRVEARTAALSRSNEELLQEIEEHKVTQAAFQESEEKWRSLVQNAPERIVTLDRDGTILFTNRTYPIRTPEDVMDTKIFAYLSPDNQASTEQALSAVFDDKKNIKYSSSHTNHEGTTETFENSFAPIIHDGEVTQAILVATDITEREKVTEALRESEENFSALAENAYDGILIFSFDGDYIYSNARITEITGYELEELASIGLLTITPLGEREKYVNWLQDRKVGENISRQFESFLTRKDNTTIPIEMTTSVTKWKGQPALLGVVRDITERKQAEEALKQRSEEIAYLHEQLKIHRVEEQTALLNLSQSLLGSTDRQEVGEKITTAMCDLFQPDFCDIYLLDETGKSLQPAAGTSWKTDLTGHPVSSTSKDSQMGFMFNSSGPVVVEDLALETRFTPAPIYVNHSIVSTLAVPMTGQEHVIGVMGVHWSRPHKLGDSEVRTLTLIANTTSATLERVRLFESEQQKGRSLARTNELITVLSQTATRLSITLDPDQVMDTIRAELNRIGLACAVFLYDQDGYRLNHIYSAFETELLDSVKNDTGIDFHDPQMVQQFLKKFYGDNLNAKNPTFITGGIIDQITTDEQLDRPFIERVLKMIGMASEVPSMWLPLIVKGQAMGILGLWGKDLQRDDLPAVNVFASQVAAAMENSQLFEQTLASRQRLRDLSTQLINVQEEERRRIARELHDEIGQSMTGLSLMLNSLYNQDQKSSDQYLKTQSLVEELIGKTQALSLDLRPAMLDEMGLLPTFLWFFERYESQTGIDVNFEHLGLNRRFPPSLETTVYRITQEALTNVARHAGVDQAEVRIWTDQDLISIQVEDHGGGFELERIQEPGTSNGLLGIRERVSLLEGSLELSSSPGTGTTMFVTIPIKPANQEKTFDVENFNRR